MRIHADPDPDTDPDPKTLLLDVNPRLYQEMATHQQPYYFSTNNAGLTQWSYETLKPLL
jgi:hypothetical protein